MNIFRKISLVCGIIAVLVCCLFLNVLGGAGLLTAGYTGGGICLIASSAALLFSLLLSISRRTWMNVAAAVFCAAGTVLYIIPIAQLNSIPNSKVPKQSIEVLTGRIYPAILATVFIACVIFANIMSDENRDKRRKRRDKAEAEKNRRLTDDEKII